jgi:hypothetical protein
MTTTPAFRLPTVADLVTFTPDGDAHVTNTTPVTIRYDVTDPWAITLDIARGSNSPVQWLFARDLLADALTASGALLAPAGVGDVIVVAEGSHVFVLLTTPAGTANLRFSRAVMEHALDEAEQLVPEGTESAAVDWDHELVLLAKGR